MYKLFIISFTIAFSLFSCNNPKESSPEKAPQLKMVDVPVIISQKRDRDIYIAQNFWSMVDFSDSSYLSNKIALNVHYKEFIDHLYSCSAETAKQSVDIFSGKLLQGIAPLRDYLLEIVELSLYDPNSSMRDEQLYSWFLQNIVQDSVLDSLTLIRYHQQLYMVLQNNPGQVANNFTLSDINGQTFTLHSIKNRYTLLMFYEPDCHSCFSAISLIDNNINNLYTTLNIKMIAVYTGEDLSRWYDTRAKFPPYWDVARDADMGITLNRLYDRRASPSFYLLDSNKKVILKDAFPEQLIQTLRELTTR